MLDPRESVIPEPQHVVYSAQTFSFRPGARLSLPDLGALDFDNSLTLIQEHFSTLGVKLRIHQDSTSPLRTKTVLAAITNRGVRPDHQTYQPMTGGKIRAQGYRLRIDDRAIVLAARDGAGLFYAFQTLLQLIRKEKGQSFAPGVFIEDWPGLQIRGAHIDPHNLAPKVSAIKDSLKHLAQQKVNTVIITYGDKIKYERHPQTSHPHAYTKAEMREVASLASALYIDFIPVVQSLGHSPNVLVNDKYAHLREGDDNITQFCPAHPGTLQFFKEIAEEVMEVHDSKHFHIGADETYFLGSCEKCRKVAKKKGKIGVYVQFVTKVCAYLRSQGKIPLVWDDMLCQSPGKVKELHPEAVICYWDYFPVDVKNPFVFFRNDGWYCDTKYWTNRKWWWGDFINSGRCKDIRELADDKIKHYKPYFTHTDDFRFLEPYPFYKFYKDSGHTVIGCPAAIGGEYGYVSPDYIKRLNNVMRMIDVVAENNGPGVISTSWSEMLIPNELIRYAFLASAEYSWSPKSVTLETFQAKFLHRYFGCDDSNLLAAMYLVANKHPPLCYRYEDHTDTKQRDWLAERETLKQLLDVRIEKMCNDPDPDKLAAELSQIVEDAEKALALLKNSRNKVKRNRHTVDHLILAARMSKHKAGQALLFLEIETALQRKVSRGSTVANGLARRLATLGREINSLMADTRALYQKTYKRYSVEARNRLVFEGEREKIEEYQRRLAK